MSGANPRAAVTCGRFVTFEGIDGAGKSSHIEALAEWARARGAEVVLAREPGGTPLAEKLRGLFLHDPMDALTEALLVFAARRDHLREVIEPALARGAFVLCDRFTDSTFAYQGAGRGFDVHVLAQLETWVQQGRQPDLTLWFDLAPEEAARRRAAVRSADRLESEDEAFFTRVRSGYALRAQAAPARFARIDAAQSREAVRTDAFRALASRGWFPEPDSNGHADDRRA
jgi:dTMP kinase